MTPADLRTAHHSLGLSAGGAARLFWVSDVRTVLRWWLGERDIPGPVIVLTEALMSSRAVRRQFGLSLPDDSTTKSE